MKSEAWASLRFVFLARWRPERDYRREASMYSMLWCLK